MGNIVERSKTLFPFLRLVEEKIKRTSFLSSAQNKSSGKSLSSIPNGYMIEKVESVP